MEKVKEEAPVEPIKEEVYESRIEAESCSDIKSLDESISEKLNKLMPDLISKVREEVIEENKIRQSQIKVENQSKIQEEVQIVHPHFICDGCGADPIIGCRFKCVVCADFDLCEKCESTSNHEHAFLKIKHPKQAPLKIFCIIDDENDSLECNGQKVNVPQMDMGFNILRQILNPQEMSQETKETFKKCKNQFKDAAKVFMQQVKKNNEHFKKCHEKTE